MSGTASFVLDAFADIVAWADADHPREACGLLFGYRKGDDFEIRYASRSKNLATEPGRFEIDPGHYAQGACEAIDQGIDLIGVWHSHPHAQAEMSDADRAGAWTEHLQVVVGSPLLRDARVRAWHGGELRVERSVTTT